MVGARVNRWLFALTGLALIVVAAGPNAAKASATNT